MSAVLLATLPDAAPLPGATLFAFDDRAFPFQNHVQAHLVPARGRQVALPRGTPGAHDEVVRFYGSVVRTREAGGDVFHLWYFGSYGPESGVIGYGHGVHDCVLCYATSRDGLRWDKPDLGLVEFRGSRHNNIVDLPHPGFRPACAIVHEADDPDPARRFKLAYEAPIAGRAGKFLCVAFSADGVRWTPSPHNPVGPFLEMAGIARWRGLYYLTGQASLTSHRPVAARRLCTFVSADFERWSACSAMGFERSGDRTGPSADADAHQYEEVHLGAALWNRGNVLLGVYGQWHGHPSGDRRLLTMDLGLVLSHDGLHYYEPIPGFRLIPAREQPETPAGSHPALMQGQAIENIGERTWCWYAPWLGPNAAGVLAAWWERDRLGYLQPFHPTAAEAVSCPIQVLDGIAPLYANVSGLGPHSRLRIDVLDEGFGPLPGYSGLDGAMVTQGGLRVPVRWAGRSLAGALGRVRLHVHFEGVRPEDCRLHALYVGEEEA
jgi:hypothetical protein